VGADATNSFRDETVTLTAIEEECMRSQPTSEVAVTERRGFDFAPFPNSWLQVAWSHELPVGAVKSVRVAGRDLVLYRGIDGAVRALDAYCAHLGAHLGVGGTVEGNEIRCPFHGWRFGDGGECTFIPCAKRIPERARVASWTVRETSGLVMIWHHDRGEAPTFELPQVAELESGEWSAPRYELRRIATRWRELCENAVDRLHFHALHEYPEPPELDFETDAHRYRMRSHVRWHFFGRDRIVRLDIDAHGAGFTVTRGQTIAQFLVLGCTTPIDEETIEQRMTFAVHRSMPWPLRDLVARIVVDRAMLEFSRDVPIWENKICQPRPVLCEADGPIPRFRKWARQFDPVPA
jgi:phenylpropionate dioxygenase-like ring-hydroxylating dioxygenase large terminal subunit